MNEFELSAVLYYADFLSLQETSTTVTDICKYFYIHGVPVNAAFILNLQPQYDINNKYFKRSYDEYQMIKAKYGNEGALSFLDNICNLGVAGAVNGIQMLKYIHRYSSSQERNAAFRKYKNFKSNMKYTHKVCGDNGLEIKECSMYVAHHEQAGRNCKK